MASEKKTGIPVEERPRPRVVVVGGGYAGLTAATRLGRAARRLEVTLFDRREDHEALPLLPDLISRRIRPRHLRTSLAAMAKRSGVRFVREEVLRLDTETRHVETAFGRMPYDWLVLACGNATAFHGQEDARRHAFELRSVADACAIADCLEEEDPPAWVVVGGGYTGIEAATQLWRGCHRHGRTRRILLVELAGTLCPGLPGWIREHVAREARHLGIETRLESATETIDPAGVTLKGGERIEGARVVWSAGVTATPLASSRGDDALERGRLRVDSFLRLGERIHAIGDAAAFAHEDGILRQSVQFSISQGKHAATNILRELAGREPRPFLPWDPGYLVPMAHNRASGLVLGRPVRGRVGTALHYLMCMARSYGLRNRAGIAANLLVNPR
jgi:NADH:ubiquinone reductase (H+-translocating)